MGYLTSAGKDVVLLSSPADRRKGVWSMLWLELLLLMHADAQPCPLEQGWSPEAAQLRGGNSWTLAASVHVGHIRAEASRTNSEDIESPKGVGLL